MEILQLLMMEGIGMNFSGPVIMYTQSHDIKNMAFEISQYLPKK